MGIHDAHRERIRQRFDQHGSAFEDYQLLEMLLYYSIPRGDTNPAAHELIRSFGGLAEVLDAPAEALQRVSGVGEGTARLIKLVQRLAVRYGEPRQTGTVILRDSAAVGAYLKPKFRGERDEMVYMLSVDAKGKLLCCSELGRGGYNNAAVDFRKVVEIAIGRNAYGVILAHNHPSGLALPSDDDTFTTDNLRTALELVGIRLLDHIIVSDDDFVSLADSGFLK